MLFRSLNKALRRIIRDCNYEVLDFGQKDAVTLPRFSNHILRHTFTTRMCEAGVNIKAMQDILGHADAETTMDIYADATKELKKKELINFEEYFSNQKSVQLGTIYAVTSPPDNMKHSGRISLFSAFILPRESINSSSLHFSVFLLTVTGGLPRASASRFSASS